MSYLSLRQWVGGGKEEPDPPPIGTAAQTAPIYCRLSRLQSESSRGTRHFSHRDSHERRHKIRIKLRAGEFAEEPCG